jgi:hypothetical protein
MLAQDQSLLPAGPSSTDEISTADLLEQLAEHQGKKLVFHYEGRSVLPGYHVTEVKTGAFQALDCGANYESWHETFIQLWDVPAEDDRGWLPVSRFLGIMGKVAASVPFDPKARLTFEVSDGERAIQLYRAASIDVDGDAVRVALTQRPASCKPRDRWLEQQKQSQASCCGPSSAASSCCN